MSRLGGLSLAILSAVALTGCGVTGSPQADNGLHRIGLTSGPLPAPKLFVVQSRPAQIQPTPFVYADPPARSDVVLNTAQQQDLEASLASKAVTPPPVTRRKKAPVTQRINPLF